MFTLQFHNAFTTRGNSGKKLKQGRILEEVADAVVI